MNGKALAGIVLTATLAIPAFAQFSVYLGSAPPPLRYERRLPSPGADYVWVDGYWGNNGRRYNWVPGRWQQPPYPGAYWNHSHYDHYDRGWQQHEGHWDRQDPGERRDDRGVDRRDDRGGDHRDDRGGDQNQNRPR